MSVCHRPRPRECIVTPPTERLQRVSVCFPDKVCRNEETGQEAEDTGAAATTGEKRVAEAQQQEAVEQKRRRLDSIIQRLNDDNEEEDDDGIPH